MHIYFQWLTFFLHLSQTVNESEMFSKYAFFHISVLHKLLNDNKKVLHKLLNNNVKALYKLVSDKEKVLLH